jgi:hypothetical protein
VKIRSGFVSNSSSASFVINLDDLEYLHKEYVADELLNLNPRETAWSIFVEDGKLKGFTTMDNFDMKPLLIKLLPPEFGECYDFEFVDHAATRWWPSNYQRGYEDYENKKRLREQQLQ